MKYKVTIASRRPKDPAPITFTVEADSAKQADVHTRKLMQVGRITVDEVRVGRPRSGDADVD